MIITTKQIIKSFKEKHGNKYNYSNVIYRTAKTNVEIVCPNHGSFFQTPYNHKTGQGCPKCQGKNKTTEEYIEEAKKIHGNKYDYSKTKYINAKNKINIVCFSCKKDLSISAEKHLSGQGCGKCNFKNTSDISNQNNLKDFINKSNIVHNNQYDYTQIQKYSSKEKLNIKCNIHGNFKAYSNHHLSGQGCPKCRKIFKNLDMKFNKDNFMKLQNEFQNRIMKNVNYDYQKTIFKGTYEEVQIECKKHGKFNLKAKELYKYHECPKCKIERKQNEFFYNANKNVSDNYYDFSESIFLGVKYDITLKCKKHKIKFTTKAENLLNFNCCPLCKNKQKLTNEEFIEKCKSIHKNKYNYEKTKFINFKDKILITCNLHGDYSMNSGLHYFRGSGCPSCSITGFKTQDKGFLYYVRINKDGEEVYKIGITNKSLKNRFKGEYQYITLIKMYEYEIGEEAYNLEQQILKDYSFAKYKGNMKLKSGGITECFSYDILGWDNKIS